MAISWTKTSKTKQALNAKTKARKKQLDQATEVAAVAASTPDTDLVPDLKIERLKISELSGLKRRVRRSEKAHIKQVAKSLKQFKQVAPILITAQREIIDGHIVVEALKLLGRTEVSCVAIDHLDEQQIELLHVTLNRLGECGDWHTEELGALLIDLGSFGFDLEITGFSVPELDILTAVSIGDDGGQASAQGKDEPDKLPPAVPVSILGDLWQLGRHRVLCGDATDPESYTAVLAGRQADLVFTDLPWNIPINGFVSSQHEDFKMACGELSADEFAHFCDKPHALGAKHLKDGALFYSCIDWRSHDVIVRAGRNAGLRHINTCVWNKGSGGMGTLYRSAHEFVVVFVKGAKPAINNVQLGKHGRDRTNVWTYPGANRPGSSANKALAHHPTPKPVEMVEDAIKDVTMRKALVLDPFLGSGTTLLAAERSGRDACGIELDPAFVDVAIRRWEELTGKLAIHASTGLTFEELRVARSEVHTAAESKKAA